MKSLLISTLVLVSMGASANTIQNYQDADYFKIKDVTVEYLGTTDEFVPMAPMMSTADCAGSGDFQRMSPIMSTTGLEDISATIDQTETILDKIVNLGKKVFNLVAEGKPVYNVNMEVAHALPMGAKCWLDLSGWSAPTSATYRIKYTNLYGIDVVDFKYRVSFIYGGQVDDKGRYIAQAVVTPANLSVSWGFKFNAEAKVPFVFNMGSKKDPIAGMQFDIKWSVDTIFEHIEQTDTYSLSGLGEIQRLK